MQWPCVCRVCALESSSYVMYSYYTILHAGCDVDAVICEVQVDTYLDDFCAWAISSIMERAVMSTTIAVYSVKLITTTGTST